MDLNTVKSIYRSTADYANKEVTLGGWIRTMRVSKNFGFIELNDGSFFKNIQIVFEADTLSNYAEITKLGVGAAIIVKGLLVETPEAKQPFEVKAQEIAIEGTSTPDYPLQKKTSQRRIPAPDRLSASQNKHVLRNIPCEKLDCICNPSVLPGQRLCIRTYSHHHRQRLRRRWGNVPRYHTGPEQPA